ncbi:MAG: ABC transporter permease [Candidatus Sericytochromatia bacterium]
MILNSKKTRMKYEFRGIMAFLERQYYITKRYLAWEFVFLFYSIVNTLTIGLIAVGMGQNTKDIGDYQTLYLIIGALIWGFLSIIFNDMSSNIAWERWEGTIEHTFMAPIHRITHLGGISIGAIIYGLARTILVLIVASVFFNLSSHNSNYLGALLVLLSSCFSFLGLGLIAAVLPLLSPEKGSQATHILEGLLLLISGIYYPISALPSWIQPFSYLSPATYTLEGVRSALLDGVSTYSLLPIIMKEFLLGLIIIPLGLSIFLIGENYAKRVGLLKRNG